MKQIYFICNLHSGRASAGAHLAMIIDKFTAAGFQVTVHPTQDRGDATACAKLACDAGCYDILFRTTIHESAQNFPTILCSAGKIGHQLELSLDSLQQVVPFQLADIIAEKAQ